MRRAAEESAKIQFKRIRLLIFFILSISYMYAPFSRMAPAILGPELMKSFTMNSVQFGLMGLCFMWPYALGQIPAGVFVDRFGSSKALVCMLLLTAAGNFLFGMAENYYLLLVSRIIIGFSVAGYFLVGTKIISAWYKKEEFTPVYGLFMGIGALGGVVSTMPLQVLMTNFGWRTVMFILSIFSLILALMVLFEVSDRPPENIVGIQDCIKNKNIFSVKQQLYGAVNIPFIFNCAFICMSISSSGHSLQSLWNGIYLSDVYGYDQKTISIILLSSAVGLVMGGTMAGYLMKHCNKLKIVLICNIIFLLSWVYMAANVDGLNTAELITLNFIFGLMQMLIITVCYTIVKEISPPAFLATSMGLVNTFIWVLGVGCCQQIWGILINIISNGVTPYCSESFAGAMWFQFCVIIFGFANTLYICKHSYNK